MLDPCVSPLLDHPQLGDDVIEAAAKVVHRQGGIDNLRVEVAATSAPPWRRRLGSCEPSLFTLEPIGELRSPLLQGLEVGGGIGPSGGQDGQQPVALPVEVAEGPWHVVSV